MRCNHSDDEAASSCILLICCVCMQAAMSLCEGNLLGAHLLCDALALAVAAAQAPWLCSSMCTVLGCFCCAVCLVLQVTSFPSSFCHSHIQPALWAAATLPAHCPCLCREMGKQAAHIISDLPAAFPGCVYLICVGMHVSFLPAP